MSCMSTVTVRVPMQIRRRPGRKTIVAPDSSAPVATRADPALVKALARAFRWRRMLEDGRYASISDIARAEKIDRGYVGSLLRLTLLAPDIVEAILDARQPEEMGLPRLMQLFPMEWSEQRLVLGTLFVSAASVSTPGSLSGRAPISRRAALPDVRTKAGHADGYIPTQHGRTP